MVTYTATYDTSDNRFDLRITNSGNNRILPIGGNNGKKSLIFKRAPEVNKGSVEVSPSLELKRDCQYHMHMDSMKDCKAGGILDLPGAHSTMRDLEIYPLVGTDEVSPFTYPSPFTGLRNGDKPNDFFNQLTKKMKKIIEIRTIDMGLVEFLSWVNPQENTDIPEWVKSWMVDCGAGEDKFLGTMNATAGKARVPRVGSGFEAMDPARRGEYQELFAENGGTIIFDHHFLEAVGFGNFKKISMETLSTAPGNFMLNDISDIEQVFDIEIEYDFGEGEKTIAGWDAIKDFIQGNKKKNKALKTGRYDNRDATPEEKKNFFYFKEFGDTLQGFCFALYHTLEKEEGNETIFQTHDIPLFANLVSFALTTAFFGTGLGGAKRKREHQDGKKKGFIQFQLYKPGLPWKMMKGTMESRISQFKNEITLEIAFIYEMKNAVVVWENLDILTRRKRDLDHKYHISTTSYEGGGDCHPCYPDHCLILNSDICEKILEYYKNRLGRMEALEALVKADTTIDEKTSTTDLDEWMTGKMVELRKAELIPFIIKNRHGNYEATGMNGNYFDTKLQTEHGNDWKGLKDYIKTFLRRNDVNRLTGTTMLKLYREKNAKLIKAAKLAAKLAARMKVRYNRLTEYKQRYNQQGGYKKKNGRNSVKKKKKAKHNKNIKQKGGWKYSVSTNNDSWLKRAIYVTISEHALDEDTGESKEVKTEKKGYAGWREEIDTIKNNAASWWMGNPYYVNLFDLEQDIGQIILYNWDENNADIHPFLEVNVRGVLNISFYNLCYQLVTLILPSMNQFGFTSDREKIKFIKSSNIIRTLHYIFCRDMQYTSWKGERDINIFAAKNQQEMTNVVQMWNKWVTNTTDMNLSRSFLNAQAVRPMNMDEDIKDIIKNLGLKFNLIEWGWWNEIIIDNKDETQQPFIKESTMGHSKVFVMLNQHMTTNNDTWTDTQIDNFLDKFLDDNGIFDPPGGSGIGAGNNGGGGGYPVFFSEDERVPIKVGLAPTALSRQITNSIIPHNTLPKSPRTKRKTPPGVSSPPTTKRDFKPARSLLGKVDNKSSAFSPGGKPFGIGRSYVSDDDDDTMELGGGKKSKRKKRRKKRKTKRKKKKRKKKTIKRRRKKNKKTRKKRIKKKR